MSKIAVNEYHMWQSTFRKIQPNISYTSTITIWYFSIKHVQSTYIKTSPFGTMKRWLLYKGDHMVQVWLYLWSVYCTLFTWLKQLDKISLKTSKFNVKRRKLESRTQDIKCVKCDPNIQQLKMDQKMIDSSFCLMSSEQYFFYNQDEGKNCLIQTIIWK